jgi:hypothetical protein
VFGARVLAGLEEGEEGDGCDVGVEDVVPFGLGLGEEFLFEFLGVFAFRVAFWARNACVGDQEVNMFLLFSDLRNEFL